MGNTPLRCSQEVKKMTLEQFRPACPGRKWKQAARSLWALLYHMAGCANPDGTFIKNGVDYSPRFKKLSRRFAKSTLTLDFGKLASLGFISWTREQHYKHRSYVLHMENICPEQFQDSMQNSAKIRKEQCQDSQEQCQDSQEQCQDSQEQCQDLKEQCPSLALITVPTTVPNPSFDSPSCNNPSNPSSAGWFDLFLQVMGIPSDAERESIDAMRTEYGDGVTSYAVNDWTGRPQGTAGLNHPWAVFLKESRAYLAKAARDCRITPGLSAEELEAYRRDYIAEHPIVDDVKNGGDPDDYFKEGRT